MGKKAMCAQTGARQGRFCRANLVFSCARNTIIAAYLAKSTPHFSHTPPCNCTWLQAGHVYFRGVWQRTQYVTASELGVAHLGHCMESEGARPQAATQRGFTTEVTEIAPSQRNFSVASVPPVVKICFPAREETQSR